MPEFTDGDLKVHLQRGETWIEDFVDRHRRHEKPHGQVKLLWSNLLGLALVAEDLGKHDERTIDLVVAGASPGIHMPVLLKHVRQTKFGRRLRIHLYDPQPLDATFQALVDADESMSFEPRPFTDEDAGHWKNSKNESCVVFFSDIRSRIHEKHEHMRADEVKIAHDMQAQKRWVQIMQPDYCMLKFHAPHATKDNSKVQKSFAYLSGGGLYEQAYVGLFSAEYRLFCTQKDIAKDHEYLTTDIERHAFWHTKYTRPSTFSVNGRHMRYDEAFAAHVAHRAAQALGFDAQELLRDAHIMQPSQMHFTWPAAQSCRLQALRLRMLQIL